MLTSVLATGRVPAAPLCHFVKVLWYAEDWQPARAGERWLPDGAVNVVIFLSGDTFGGEPALVSGPRSESSMIAVRQLTTSMGAHFKRGRTRPFFGAPASDLTNGAASLADVCGPAAASLRDRLLETDGINARLDLLEKVWSESGNGDTAAQPENP